MKEKIKNCTYWFGALVIIFAFVLAGGECDTVWQQIILEVCCLIGGYAGWRLCQWSKTEEDEEE